ncbi:hypothetical protein [Flavobacterium aestuarii]|uniref:hypothetical protein n=1 Tax=Flavobacterium aestuarii TaxID=3149227 RepID=UPI0032B3EF08
MKNSKTRRNNFLDVSKLRSKKTGEVFTPLFLVEEMLDKVPAIEWRKKNNKILDPCMGATCVFPIMVMFRMASGLRTSIKDPRQRIKHILNENLYMCEIDKEALEFGSSLLKHYANIFSVFLLMDDTDETICGIKSKYIEYYDGIIENFYEKIRIAS